MKQLIIFFLLITYFEATSQYDYGLEVDQHDAKIEGKLNLYNENNSVIIGNDAGIGEIPIVNNPTSENVYIGFSAGIEGIQASGNTFVGSNAGKSNVSNHNTFIGKNSGLNVSGQDSWDNTFVGRLSGSFLSAGQGNTYLGTFAGGSILSGSFNTILGYDSGPNNVGNINTLTGSYNVFIGSHAGEGIAPQEDFKLVIESDPNQQGYPLIYGEFDQNSLTINGSLHISELLQLTPQSQPTCDATSIGTIYLDPSENLFLCKSNGWKEISIEP